MITLEWTIDWFYQIQKLPTLQYLVILDNDVSCQVTLGDF